MRVFQSTLETYPSVEVGASVSGATLTGGLDDVLSTHGFGAATGLKVMIDGTPTKVQVLDALKAITAHIERTNLYS